MTAVEWLENQIMTSKYFHKLMEDINSRSTIAQSNIFEQAQEMEKEQIIDAMDVTQRTDFYVKYEGSEHYYNETFKTKQQ